MIFKQEKAIYQQMADRMCDEILSGRYADDERVPSVREYAADLEVNSNTAFKAFEQLARQEIIYNRRGMGYFVAPGARQKIVEQRRQEFHSDWLPELFRHMDMLNIPIEEVTEEWKNHKFTTNNTEKS